MKGKRVYNQNPGRTPSQWLGYEMVEAGRVTVKHIGPFGESPMRIAAQL